ncbi:MAG TPA: P27 family phage terminase small subunit, partial [Phycisphaerales bacterium]|nr:P27 family phage terminase small subunit [Phycisphaerales bacterium]
KEVLTTWDLTTFAQYCWHWGEWRALCSAIKKAKEGKKDLRSRYTATTSKGGECLDVLVQAQFKTLAICRSLATEFGLTPSSRTRIKTGGKQKGNVFGELDSRRKGA